MIKYSSLVLIIFLLISCQGTKVNLKKNETLPLQQWRKSRPPSDNSTSINFPNYNTFTLKNGLTVYHYRNSNLPLVSLNFVVNAGSNAEKYHKAGLSSMVIAMLEQGAAGKNAWQISEEAANLGTGLNFSSNQDFLLINSQLLSKYTDSVLHLLSQIVRKPDFPQKDFTRLKKNKISALAASKAYPSFLAKKSFLRHAYSKKHPYGHLISGDEVSVKSITLKDIKQYWQKYFGPKSSALIICGDISLTKAKQLAGVHFASWDKSSVAIDKVTDVEPHKKITLDMITRDDSSQSTILIGRPLLTMKSKDKASYIIFNQILGGMFSSRVNMNLREDKGWSYGAFSSMKSLKGPGAFTISTNIHTPFTVDAIEELFKEFDKIKTQKVTNQELKSAKQRIIKSFPAQYETLSSIAQQMVMLYIYDLKIDYFERYLNHIKNVNKTDVLRAANNSLNYDDLNVIVVGDPAVKKPIYSLSRFKK